VKRQIGGSKSKNNCGIYVNGLIVGDRRAQNQGAIQAEAQDGFGANLDGFAASEQLGEQAAAGSSCDANSSSLSAAEDAA
jgi:hypothetical protein